MNSEKAQTLAKAITTYYLETGSDCTVAEIAERQSGTHRVWVYGPRRETLRALVLGVMPAATPPDTRTR